MFKRAKTNMATLDGNLKNSLAKIVPADRDMVFVKREATKPAKKEKLCLCRALKPTMVLVRILGVYPIVSGHTQDGTCTFKMSLKWLIHSMAMYVLMIAMLLFATDIFDIFKIYKGRSLHSTLSAISDIFYGGSIVVIIIINIGRYPRFILTLNKMVSMQKDGLLCQSSLRGILKVQYVAVMVFFVVLIAQYSLLAFLVTSQKYLTDFFDYKFYLNKLTPILFFFFDVIFVNLTSVIVGMSGCFQKIAIACLNFEPAHPLKDVDDSNNHAEFLGVYRYKICERSHDAPPNSKLLTSSERVELLRCLHEQISAVTVDINESLDPQFLVHVVAELTALIINWYAVILCIAYEFTAEITKTVNVLNIFFVTVHTIGILTFLKHGQQLQTLVSGLTNFLLEYSTKISLPDEHQQIRIFIQKLKLHRPLTANGVFNIDLGIAGPVFANILTYVLVALQFDVPKN